MNMEQRPFSLSIYLQDPIALLWRFWASPRLSLILLALCFLIILLSLLLPQTTPQIEGDAVAYGRWLAGIHGRYGTGVDLARALGLFHIRDSFVWRSLLVALTFNLILSTAEQMQKIAAAARWQGTPEEGDFRQEWTAAHSLPRPDVVVRLAAYLRHKRLSIRQERDETQPIRLLAWPFPWGDVFRALPHLGILLVLGGLLVTERLGWRETDLPLSEGQQYFIGHGSDLTLSGGSVAVSFLPDGAPSAWQSEMTLSQPGREVWHGRVRSGLPLYYRGLLFCQSGVGPSIEVTAQDEKGQPVAVQTLLSQISGGKESSLRFRDNGDEGYFAVPSRNLILRLTFYTSLPQRGKVGPVIHVQAYRGGQVTPVWDIFVQDETTWTLEGTRYRFRRKYYALFQIAFAPGWPFIIFGLLLSILGSWNTWGNSSRALRVVISGQQDQIVARLYYDGTPDSVSEQWFQHLGRGIVKLLHE